MAWQTTVRLSRWWGAGLTLVLLIAMIISTATFDLSTRIERATAGYLLGAACAPAVLAWVLRPHSAPRVRSGGRVLGQMVLLSTAWVLILVARELATAAIADGGLAVVVPGTVFLALAMLAGICGASLVEEVLFRVGLPRLLTRLLRRHARIQQTWTVPASCAVFALAHGPTTSLEAVEHFVFAYLMFQVISRGGGLGVAIALHAISNVGALLMTTSGTALAGAWAWVITLSAPAVLLGLLLTLPRFTEPPAREAVTTRSGGSPRWTHLSATSELPLCPLQLPRRR